MPEAPCYHPLRSWGKGSTVPLCHHNSSLVPPRAKLPTSTSTSGLRPSQLMSQPFCSKLNSRITTLVNWGCVRINGSILMSVVGPRPGSYRDRVLDGSWIHWMPYKFLPCICRNLAQCCNSSVLVYASMSKDPYDPFKMGTDSIIISLLKICQCIPPPNISIQSHWCIEKENMICNQTRVIKIYMADLLSLIL